MKLIIDISDKEYEHLKITGACQYCGIVRNAIRDGIPISNEQTNLEVLQLVFPRADIKLDARDNNFYGYIEFAGDWLEAPYGVDKDKDNELTIVDNVKIGISTCHNFMTLVGYYKPTEHDKIYEKMMEITNDHDVSTDVADWCKLATVDGNNIVGEAYELPECTIYAIDHAKMNELNEKISKGW